LRPEGLPPREGDPVAVLVSRGWTKGGFPPIPIRVGLDWAGTAASHRSWGFKFHAWDFFNKVLTSDVPEAEFRSNVEWAAAIALDWGRWFRVGNVEGTQALYDMAIAHRSAWLARLAAAFVLEFPDRPDAAAELLGLVEL